MFQFTACKPVRVSKAQLLLGSGMTEISCQDVVLEQIFSETAKYTYALFRGKPISTKVSISDDIFLYFQFSRWPEIASVCSLCKIHQAFHWEATKHFQPHYQVLLGIQ